MPNVSFTPDAVADILDLDNSALRYVLGGIAKLEVDADYGKPLGSNGAGNLTGFRKLVVGDRQWRIVYRVERGGAVVVVFVVASRVDQQCYDLAIARLDELGDERFVDLRDVLVQLRPSSQKLVHIRTDPGSEAGADIKQIAAMQKKRDRG